MKTTLKTGDRIIIPVVLRFITNGGYAKFVTAKNIIRKVELSPEELERYDVHDHANGSTSFNAKLDTGTEFEFTDREVELMREALKRMDERKALSWDFIPLYETFVGAASDTGKNQSDVKKIMSDVAENTSDITENISDQI